MRANFSGMGGLADYKDCLHICYTWLYDMPRIFVIVLYATYLCASGVGQVHLNRKSSTASRSSVCCYLVCLVKRLTIIIVLKMNEN